MGRRCAAVAPLFTSPVATRSRAEEADRLVLQDEAGEPAGEERAGIDAYPIGFDLRYADDGVPVHDAGAEVLVGIEEAIPNPHHVGRALLREGYAGADTGVNEDVVALPMAVRQGGEKPTERFRHGIPQGDRNRLQVWRPSCVREIRKTVTAKRGVAAVDKPGLVDRPLEEPKHHVFVVAFQVNPLAPWQRIVDQGLENLERGRPAVHVIAQVDDERIRGRRGVGANLRVKGGQQVCATVDIADRIDASADGSSPPPRPSLADGAGLL